MEKLAGNWKLRSGKQLSGTCKVEEEVWGVLRGVRRAGEGVGVSEGVQGSL